MLESFVEAKRQIAKRYRESLGSLPGICLPQEAEWAFSTYWMYTLLIDEKESGIDSRTLIRELGSQKIQTRPLWQPMHRSPAHNSFGSPACPISDDLHRKGISVPCSAGLSESAQGQVIESMKAFLGKVRPSAMAG